MDIVVYSSGGDSSTKGTSSDPAVLIEPQEESDVFGEPELLPRVGEEYQVSLPEMVSRFEYVKKLACEVTGIEVAGKVSGSLPLSLKWVQPLPGSNVSEAVGSEGKVASKVDKEGAEKSGIIRVPGASYDPWSKSEEEIFLLGLYIFGRNFLLVKEFVGSNNIGKILSHYYGEFYRSEKYETWISCRRTRGRSCATEHKIFMGSRLQQLTSCLLPQLSEEDQNKLLQVTQTFSSGKMMLEEYVMTLKNMVGVHNLVEAVGIGTGKKDLTRTVLEKSNQATQIEPRRPTRACLALSSEEIITLLQSKTPLSKARSNGLFWEVVWPRLLAKGWNSEQPKKGIFSNEYLVFLVPGVKKFSRRDLVKGQDYFDSVFDVLNKVISEPGILDLNGGSGGGHRIEEANREQQKPKNREQRRYRKPRTQSLGGNEEKKITVIDTGVENGETRKLRVLKELPVEPSPVQIGSPLAGMERNNMEVDTNAWFTSADILNSVNINEKTELPVNTTEVDLSLKWANRRNRDGCNYNVGRPSFKWQREPQKRPDGMNTSASDGKRRMRNLSFDISLGSVIAVSKESEKEETIHQSGAAEIKKENRVTDGGSEVNHKPQSSMLVDSSNESVQSDRLCSKDDEGKQNFMCQGRTRKRLDGDSISDPEAGKRRNIMEFSSENQMGECSAVDEDTKAEFEKEETKSCAGTCIVENENVEGGENEAKETPRTPLWFDLNLPPMPEPQTDTGTEATPIAQQGQSNRQVNVPVTTNANPCPIRCDPEATASTRRRSGRNRSMSIRAVESLASSLMARETRWR